MAAQKIDLEKQENQVKQIEAQYKLRLSAQQDTLEKQKKQRKEKLALRREKLRQKKEAAELKRKELERTTIFNPGEMSRADEGGDWPVPNDIEYIVVHKQKKYAIRVELLVRDSPRTL